MNAKKYIFQIITVTIILICQIKIAAQPGIKRNNPMIIGHIDSLYSNILKEQRIIWIHVPENPGNFAPEKYPVVFVLDGPFLFQTVNSIIKHLGPSKGNAKLPEMIIVGISNTNRFRDLTPFPVNELDSFLNIKTGGGDKFISFIENELIPFVESKYPATSYRTFVGHSLGGLTVFNTLLSRKDLFENYIAIDPSLTFSFDFSYINKADSILRTANFYQKSCFMAFSNHSGKIELEEFIKDTSLETLRFRKEIEFVENSESYTGNRLKYKWKYYQDDDHGTVPLIAAYDALRFIFSWYNVPDFSLVGFELDPAEIIKKIENHYEMISKNFGYKVLPNEKNINTLAYGFLRNKRMKEAYTLFNMNLLNYPQSPNAHDAMGDYYMKMNDKKKAIEYAKKSIKLSDLPYYKEKLKKLIENE